MIPVARAEEKNDVTVLTFKKYSPKGERNARIWLPLLERGRSEGSLWDEEEAKGRKVGRGRKREGQRAQEREKEKEEGWWRGRKRGHAERGGEISLIGYIMTDKYMKLSHGFYLRKECLLIL